MALFPARLGIRLGTPAHAAVGSSSSREGLLQVADQRRRGPPLCALPKISATHSPTKGYKAMPSATELLRNFFYPEFLNFLADDVEWNLPSSLWNGVAGSHRGREAVLAMFDKIMTEFYDPATIDPQVITAFATDRYATTVFTMKAVTWWGQPYMNDYMITIECDNEGKIARVHEYFDTKRLYDTMDNERFG
jgi:ketosteroid isomerase-like protein